MSPAQSAAQSPADAPTGTVRHPIARILVYYLVFMTVAGGLVWQSPAVEALLSHTGGGGPSVTEQFRDAFLGGGSVTAAAPNGWGTIILAAVALLSSLFIMIPVAWSYIFIKRQEGYDQSVVHALLILPVAVTGIVVIVKTSLPLAFSLAGIVAAVRFRTTLNDTKDAVYIFLAIGVGLASGAYAIGLAFVLSVVFNAVNLVLWRLNFGNVYVDRLKRTGGMSFGDAVAGAGSASTAVQVGDRRLMAALAPRELADVAARLARTDRYLKAEAETRKERKHYSILLVYTSAVAPAQAAAEAVLERMALRWSLAEILPGDGEVSILEYLARLDEVFSAGDLLDAVRSEGGAAVKAAELRSLRALGRRD